MSGGWMKAVIGLVAVLAPPVAGPSPPAAPAAPADTSGFSRFLQQQTDAATAALRKKDYAAAEAAWSALLELDPDSLAGLEGLAETAHGRGDVDAEVLARTELDESLNRAILAGDKAAERTLAKSAARLAEIDPLASETAALLATYSNAQAELGAAYLDAGLWANALACWQRRAALAAPGSPEAAEARSAIQRILLEGSDDVASAFDPSVLAGQHDKAWIEDFDKRTAKFSNAGKWETPHYRIKSNAGWQLGSDAAATMERVQGFYREIWGIVPDPKPEKVPPGLREITITPIDVNIFATRDEYVTRAGTGNKSDWSGGVFKGSEVDTYDQGETPGKGSRATMTTLFHECSHQFMYVAVGDVPSFVNEGIASLFEGIEILSNGSVRRDLPVARYLTPLSEALADGSAKPLRSIMNAQENEPEQYQYRWGVFYFLRMFVDGQGQYVYRDKLQEYIYDFKRGGVGMESEHFTDFFVKGVSVPGIESFDDFERVWKQWIIDLGKEASTSDKRLEEFRSKGRLAALKDDHEGALRFWEKMLDIDPDDLDGVFGVAAACDKLGRPDRAIAGYRRFLGLAGEEDKRRTIASRQVAALDEHDGEMQEARSALAGGMAGIALKYDQAKLPRMAMRCGHKVLDIDPYEASARALVTRLERDSGIVADHWLRLFNGFDLSGWYRSGTAGKGGSFSVTGGAILNDSKLADNADIKAEDDSAVYQTLFVDRSVTGDWSLEARIKASSEWQIAGLCFGARDGEHFEAIVLRQAGDDTNKVDVGTFAGGWTFIRNDGAVKVKYDARKGTMLRLDVRGRQVSVSIDGQPVDFMVGGKSVHSLTYPLAALRGDIGLLAAKGQTRFTDIRLLSGRK